MVITKMQLGHIMKQRNAHPRDSVIRQVRSCHPELEIVFDATSLPSEVSIPGSIWDCESLIDGMPVVSLYNNGHFYKET